MTDFVIETWGLTVYYGRHRGILDVDLQVKKGEVFGFLGPNGAGKTTTQRVLMGIIPPTRGKASLFGFDCQKEGVAARTRVGYLPGELSLYNDLKAKDFFQMYLSLQKRGQDSGYWRILADRLELDTNRKIRQYSQGNKQKVGVVMAFMNKPDLLILDEPTSGLDPLMKQIVLDLVQEVNQAGTTVFFSSHILSEVQEVCDRVGIIREGRLVVTERVADLIHQQSTRIRFLFAEVPPGDAFTQYSVKELARDGHALTLEIDQDLAKVMVEAAAYGIENIETNPVTLEEIFLAYYGKGKDKNHV